MNGVLEIYIYIFGCSLYIQSLKEEAQGQCLPLAKV
jgi:hypothetical protein